MPDAGGGPLRLVVDGREIGAKRWDTVMTATRRAGVRIMSLCHHDALPPGGACRLCVVEVRRRGEPQPRVRAACECAVEDGMIVSTNTDALRRMRRNTLDMLLARAPGDATITALIAETGLPSLSLSPVPDAGGCILCGLCVRACDKMGLHAISLHGRGDRRKVGPPYGVQTDACIGCASCASVCPVDCIPVEDTPDGRRIWGKEFAWVRCSSCGAPVVTEAVRDYAVARRPLDPSYFALCRSCKESQTVARFFKVGE